MFNPFSMKPFHHLLQSTLFLILSRCLSKDRRHVFFFEIGRDVEGIEVLEVLSMTYAVFAEPLGSRRQVLSEAVEYPRGRAPGRNGKVHQGGNRDTYR